MNLTGSSGTQDVLEWKWRGEKDKRCKIYIGNSEEQLLFFKNSKLQLSQVRKD